MSPAEQPAPGMRKRFLTTVFVMAAVLARMLARIWLDKVRYVKAQEFAPLASPGAVHYVTLLWFIAIILGNFFIRRRKHV